MKSKSMYLKKIVVGLGLFMTPFLSMAYEKSVEAVIDLSHLFSPDCDLESGIVGTVNEGGKIEVTVRDKQSETLVFHTILTQSATSFSGESVQYAKSSLGTGAAYYPNTWNSHDIKTALGSIDRKRYDDVEAYPYAMFAKPIELQIEIQEENAQMKMFKIPGVGVIDRNGGNTLFHPNHYCYNLKNAMSLPAKAWTKMKTPDITKTSDLSIAAHRGIWGDMLGAGSPENSTEAIERTKQFTDILESDIMITKDKQLIVSHDYNLHRLSDYAGSDRDYLFDMNGEDQYRGTSSYLI